MQELPVGARVFIWLVGLGGALFAGLLIWKTGGSNLDLIGIAFFGVVLFLGDLYRFRLQFGVSVSVATAVHFTFTVLFGPGWAASAALLSAGISDLRLGKSWYKALFNGGAAALYAGIPGLLYFAVYEGASEPLGSVRNVCAIIIYGSASILVNTSLVSVIISLTRRAKVWDVWMENFRECLLQFATTIPIGFLAAIAYRQFGPVGTLFLTLPSVAGAYAVRKSQIVREQTMQTIEILADSVDKRDTYTYRHSQEVADYAEAIAKRMGLPLAEISTIVSAAHIHDLGKVGIPDRILQKPGKLDHDEIKEMQHHPRIGAEIVSKLSVYGKGKAYVLCHQEWFDGRGYPLGLRGEEIPLGARIIGVADAFQAMTSDRPYRRAMTEDMAIAQLRLGRGTQFDPVVVDTFIALLEEQREVARVKAAAPSLSTQPNVEATPSH